MADTSVTDTWVERARQLKRAGAYGVSGAEVAAVHAALYPDAAPICSTCPGVILPAFQAVLRWLRLHDSSTSFSSTAVANTTPTTAKFTSDDIEYTPFGLGVTYTNANLTDAAARHILKHDPDAARLFATLPAEESAQESAAAERSAPAADTPADSTPAVATVAAGIDYDLLADKVADKLMERFKLSQEPSELPAVEPEAAPALAVTAEQDDTDESKPVALSRANKAQLQDLYRAELKQEPGELHADDLRKAISDHRAGAGSAAE